MSNDETKQIKRNTLSDDLKDEIIRKTKMIRDEHPEMSLLDICISMVYHFYSTREDCKEGFATVEAVVLCTKSFFDIENMKEGQVRKTMN
jgi:hypothetical protein